MAVSVTPQSHPSPLDASNGHRSGKTVSSTSRVEVEDLGPFDNPSDTGKRKNIDMNEVSESAPLAALLDHAANDSVRVPMPNGAHLIKIIRIN